MQPRLSETETLKIPYEIQRFHRTIVVGLGDKKARNLTLSLSEGNEDFQDKKNERKQNQATREYTISLILQSDTHTSLTSHCHPVVFRTGPPFSQTNLTNHYHPIYRTGPPLFSFLLYFQLSLKQSFFCSNGCQDAVSQKEQRRWFESGTHKKLQQKVEKSPRGNM